MRGHGCGATRHGTATDHEPATLGDEILGGLGLESHLVGVSHECDVAPTAACGGPRDGLRARDDL